MTRQKHADVDSMESGPLSKRTIWNSLWQRLKGRFFGSR